MGAASLQVAVRQSVLYTARSEKGIKGAGPICVHLGKSMLY